MGYHRAGFDEIVGVEDECPGVEVYIWKPSDWDEIVEVMR